MPPLARLTIGHYALAACALLALACGLELFMIRDLQDALAAEPQAADARIARLEKAVAELEHRLSPRIIAVSRPESE